MMYGNVKQCERLLTMPISKKLSNLNTMSSSPIIPSAYCGYLLNTDVSVVNRHFREEKQNKNKRGGSISINMEEVSMGAARWTPTPEQLYALEEIYQSGIRTPSANQIQQIALRLGRFGKIEGKNVFYWFQNHKARDRQKRRRQQLNHHYSLPNEQHLHVNNIQSLDIKSSGLTRTGFEVGQAKNWVTPSSDCSTVSEESVTLSTTEFTKCEIDKRIQFEGRRLERKSSIIAKHAMSQMTEFSLISAAVDHHKAQNLDKFLVMPKRDINTRKYQTLELFPRWNFDHQVIYSPKFSTEIEVPTVNTITKFTPTQYFEFL